MSSALDSKPNFASNEERVPQSKEHRKRIMGRVDPKTFSDSTHPFSAAPTRRKNRFQSDFVGIGPGDEFAKERLINRLPPSHQNVKYEDDNVRFLATGSRLRPSTPYDRVPRMFELSTQRIQRLNTFPDGTPRSGFPADLSQEQLMQTELGNAVTDLTSILRQGIPQQGPLNLDDYKKLLAGQFQSPGVQSLIFNQEQHKIAAEAEAKARADEIKQLLEQGNVSRGKLIDEFRTLQEQGEITKDQLDAMIKLTGQLATEKDDAVRQQLVDELSNDVQDSMMKRKAAKIKLDLDKIATILEPQFRDIEDNKKINGVDAQLDDKNVITLGDAIDHNNSLTWTELVKYQTANHGDQSISFKDSSDIVKSIDNLEKGKWSTGVGSSDKNRERLALVGILNFVNDNGGKLPSYEQIIQIQRLSKDKKYKGFAQANRSALFTDFVTDVNDKILKPTPAMITPATSPKAALSAAT